MKFLTYTFVFFSFFALSSCNGGSNAVQDESDNTSADTLSEKNMDTTDSQKSPEEQKALFTKSVGQLNNFFTASIENLEEKVEKQDGTAKERTEEKLTSLRDGQKKLKAIEEKTKSGELSWDEGLTQIQELVKEKGITPVSAN